MQRFSDLDVGCELVGQLDVGCELVGCDHVGEHVGELDVWL